MSTKVGTIGLLPSGRYRARLPAAYGQRSIGTFRTEGEAKIAPQREVAKLVLGLAAPTNGRPPTVGALLRDITTDEARALSTRRTYAAASARLESLHGIRVDRLTKERVSEVILGLVADGVPAPTADQARRVLATALNAHAPGLGTRLAGSQAVWKVRTQAARDARASRDVTILPAEVLAALPRWVPTRDPIPRRKPLKRADGTKSLTRRLDARADPTWALLFEFIGWTGLREGEALGVLVEQVLGATGPVLTIREAAIASTRRMGRTKTATSERDVPVPTRLWDRLVAHARTRPRNGFLFGPHATKTTDSTRPLAASAVSRRWEAVAHGIGAPPQTTVHDLRATFAALMIDAGATMIEVQKALGHAEGSTVTAKHYARVIAEVPPWRRLRGKDLSFEDRLSRAYDSVNPDPTAEKGPREPTLTLNADRDEQGRAWVQLPTGEFAYIVGL